MKKCCECKKFDNFLDMTKINELLKRKKEEPVVEEKKCHKLRCVLIIVGIVLVVAGIAFALYKYFTPDYVDDLDDDFDDDFDDDEDEESEEDSDDNQ